MQLLPPASAGEGLNEGIGVLNISLFAFRGLTGGPGVGGTALPEGGGGTHTFPYEYDT